MKDSSLIRFTLVPSAVAFAIGIAMGAAIGWPPELAVPQWLTGERAPAWTQAVLSAAAIWFAGRFAVAQHRRQIRERAGVVVAMASQLGDEAVAWAGKISEGVHGSAAQFWEYGDLKLMVDGLALVPLHELPHVAMVQPIIAIQRGSVSLLTHLQALKKKAYNSYPITPADDEECRALAASIIDARHRLHDVQAAHFKPSWLDRITGR